jgi:hypothetical protein
VGKIKQYSYEIKCSSLSCRLVLESKRTNSSYLTEEFLLFLKEEVINFSSKIISVEFGIKFISHCPSLLPQYGNTVFLKVPASNFKKNLPNGLESHSRSQINGQI